MGLDAREAGEVPVPGGRGAVSKESTQLKRHRGAKQERPLTPEQYSMKKVLSVERAGAASLATL